MGFYAFYVIAAVILILHFTGWLKRHNVEWLILVLAVAVFPVVIFLRKSLPLSPPQPLFGCAAVVFFLQLIKIKH